MASVKPRCPFPAAGFAPAPIGVLRADADWNEGARRPPQTLRRGQLTFLSLEEFLPGGGQAALVRHALGEGYPGVRLSVRADAALGCVTDEQYQMIDQLMDELCVSLPVSAMCQYDAGRTVGRSLATVIESHPDVLRDDQMRVRRRGDVVSVAGAIDLASAEAVALMLHGACQSQHAAEVIIDLSELTFIDVAGCRALVAGTSIFRGDGGTVLLRGANGHIREVMTLLRIDRMPAAKLA